MKRFFCALLIFITVFLIYAPSLSVFAETKTAERSPSLEDSATDEFKDALSFSCYYDAESKKISVTGSMHYESFAEHKNSKLLIYAVPPGASEYDVAKTAEPLAEADVSIRFDFTFSLKEFLDRYSRYAVFLRTAEGELVLGTEAQYPEVESKVKNDKTKSYFKGLLGCRSSYYADVDAGTVILPVYLDELFTETSGGYIYHFDDGKFFFSMDYIDQLDAMIRSVFISGGKVYLQYLLRESESFGIPAIDGAEYYLPDIYNQDVLLKIHSLTDFLVSRYTEGSNGKISGIVIGKRWDSYFENNNCALDELETYSYKCGDYAIVVANAARSIDPEIEIILPVSAENFRSDAEFRGVTGKTFSTKAIIDSLLYYFDNSLEEGMVFSFLLESDEVPFGISNENIGEGIDLDFSEYRSEIYVGNQNKFAEYLKTTTQEYKSGAENYIFQWSPPDGLSGNALCCAYAYSYYALKNDENIFAFVSDFSTSENDRMGDVYKVIKYIDTVEGAEVTQNLLEYFKKDSWDSIVNGALDSADNPKAIYTGTPMLALPENVTGSFRYFNFSKVFSDDGWYRGIGCQSLKTAYATSEIKALSASLSLSDKSRSEIVYAYENYEKLTYTPYINFEFLIEDSSEDSLYEILIIFENSSSRLESYCIVRGNEITQMALDLAEERFGGSFENVENLKISVRSIHGDATNCTLWLHGVDGYSTEYSSKELQSLIEHEREMINSSEAQEDTDSLADTLIAMAVLSATGLLGIGVFLVLRRDNHQGKDD